MTHKEDNDKFKDAEGPTLTLSRIAHEEDNKAVGSGEEHSDRKRYGGYNKDDPNGGPEKLGDVRADYSNL